VHRGMRGQSFVYELLFDGPAASEAPHLSGLIDVATMASSRGSEARFAPPTRGEHLPLQPALPRSVLPSRDST
jgi:hypothetical protein